MGAIVKAIIINATLIFLLLAFKPLPYDYVATAYVHNNTIIPAKILSSQTFVYPSGEKLVYTVTLDDRMYAMSGNTFTWTASLAEVDYPPLKHVSHNTYTVTGNYSTITAAGKVFTLKEIDEKIFPEKSNIKILFFEYAATLVFTLPLIFGRKKVFFGKKMELVLTLPGAIYSFIVLGVLWLDNIFLVLVLIITTLLLIWYVNRKTTDKDVIFFTISFEIVLYNVFLAFVSLGIKLSTVLYLVAMAPLVLTAYIMYYGYKPWSYHAYTPQDLPEHPEENITYFVFLPDKKSTDVLQIHNNFIKINEKLYKGVEEVWAIYRNSRNMIELL